MKNNSLGNLRAFRAAVVLILIAFTHACTKPPLTPDTCPGGCDAQMVFPSNKDQNGYYHVELDWTREYLPYFHLDATASKVDPYYHYNGIGVVSAEFDSNTTWILGDSLVYSNPTYNPFTGNYSSAGAMIPVNVNELVLTQFAGIELNVVQGTSVYFSDNGTNLKSKRIVGPFPPQMIGDTITIYMEVFWDAGMNSKLERFSEKFIVK